MRWIALSIFDQPRPGIVLCLSASRIQYDKFNISTRGKTGLLLHPGRSPCILLCMSGPRIYNRFSIPTRQRHTPSNRKIKIGQWIKSVNFHMRDVWRSRFLNGDAMLLPYGEAPTWRPKANSNIC